MNILSQNQLSRYQLIELDLSDNLIELRDDLFSSLGKHLEILKLDKNNIGSLPRFAFSGLEKLDSLSLRENKISCISNDTFASKELGNLKKLDIYGNELSEIGAGTLELFPKLEFLNIMDNRINCNCLFKETAQYLKNHKVKKHSHNLYGRKTNFGQFHFFMLERQNVVYWGNRP